MGIQVVLLHGFTGSTEEMQPLANAFAAAGHHVLLPTLAGHGSTKEALEQVSFEALLASAEAALLSLDPHRPTVVVGLSMGGLLATLLAAQYPERVSGLVLLAPAFFMTLPVNLAVLLSRVGVHHFWRFIPKKSRDIAHPQDPASTRVSSQIPLKSFVAFDALRRKALDNLARVHAPCMVFFGAMDRTVDVQRTRSFVNSHLCAPKETVMLSRSGHVLPLDGDADRIIKDVLHFFQVTDEKA